MVRHTQAGSVQYFLSKLLSIQTTQILYTLLLIASFLIGYLFAKVQVIEQQGTKVAAATDTTQTAQAPQQQAAPPTYTADDIKAWASDIGLDSNKFNQCFDDQKFASNIDKDIADAKTVSVEATPSFLINGKLVVGALPFADFKKEIDTALSGTKDPNAKEIANGHFPVDGNDNAAVTIVEFSDLECPFCRRFWSETYPQIKKDYIDTGKAKMYFRHYPLEFHPNAKPFANAVECANEQDKFWDMHNKILSTEG